MKLGFIYLAVLLLLILSIVFDAEIVRAAADLGSGWLNEFMFWASYGGTWFFVLIVMTSLFLWSEKKRKWIPPLWLSLGISMALAFLIKYFYYRERPYLALDLPLLLERGGSSFPSGHATAVFSTLAVLDKEFPRLKWFWFGFALLVAFSRVYLGVHYLSDVVVGGILGGSVGLLVVHFWEKKFRK